MLQRVFVQNNQTLIAEKCAKIQLKFGGYRKIYVTKVHKYQAKVYSKQL